MKKSKDIGLILSFKMFWKRNNVSPSTADLKATTRRFDINRTGKITQREFSQVCKFTGVSSINNKDFVIPKKAFSPKKNEDVLISPPRLSGAPNVIKQQDYDVHLNHYRQKYPYTSAYTNPFDRSKSNYKSPSRGGSVFNTGIGSGIGSDYYLPGRGDLYSSKDSLRVNHRNNNNDVKGSTDFERTLRSSNLSFHNNKARARLSPRRVSGEKFKTEINSNDNGYRTSRFVSRSRP